MDKDYKNYDKDISISKATEIEISKKLFEYYGWKTVKFNNDNRYDLLIKKNNKFITIEIKEDFTLERTGNIGIEYWSRGKFSGIDVTKSKYYLIKAHRPNEIIFLLIKVEDIKEMIKKKEYFRIVIGGDKGSGSANYLFKYDKMFSKSKVLFDKSIGVVV